jgi:hypothetical protein
MKAATRIVIAMILFIVLIFVILSGGFNEKFLNLVMYTIQGLGIFYAISLVYLFLTEVRR